MTHAEWLAACPLRVWMKQHRTTHTRLAVELKATRQAVSSWLTGSSVMSPGRAQRMAELMGMTTGEYDRLMHEWRMSAPRLEADSGNES